ncbi:MAG: hypothetical protein MUC29_08075 [Pyrinomonadaceae bacterium]|jgi:hypothetical protein|nr:hypothetical protein [Pyrinomonadaceae bacterium]
MKKVFLMLILLFTLSFTNSVFGQGNNGCVNGKRNGIYYTDCWADTGDDTARLQAVINMAVGKIVFNENDYSISAPLTLYAFRIIEGQGVNTYGFPSTKITATSGGSIFKIGPGVFDVSIRDLGLYYISGILPRPVGILAEGTYAQGGSNRFQFSNLRFTGLDKGIHVKSTNNDGAWQFDSVKLDNATFEDCNTGIEIDAFDSGWHMANVTFSSGANQNGIKIIRGGYMSLNMIVGNGLTNSPGGVEPVPLSNNFIEIGEHSVISIQNSVGENYKKNLLINSVLKFAPIHLINNAFGNTVEINNSNVVSTGNFYGNAWGKALPVIKGNSDVFSIGDRFCWQNAPQSNCVDSKWDVQSTTATLQQSVATNDPATELNRPAMKILHPSINKVLLEVGNYNAGGEFVYRLKRDNLGRLRFEASQADPWKGYIFDGTVRFGVYTQATLPTGTTANGDMTFCSDCKPNTTPCQGGGTGTLAILANNQWACK